MALVDDIEAKILIKKLIELSYSINEGVTVSLLMEAGGATLSIDQYGDVRLSGAVTVGPIVFSGSSALKEIGAKFKFAKINLSNQPGFGIAYRASFYMPSGLEITVHGSFDIKELITSCGWSPCEAARNIIEYKRDRKKYWMRYNGG